MSIARPLHAPSGIVVSFAGQLLLQAVQGIMAKQVGYNMMTAWRNGPSGVQGRFAVPGAAVKTPLSQPRGCLLPRAYCRS